MTSKQGFHDAQRVKKMIDTAVSIWSSEGFKNNLLQLQMRWVDQLAYGYINRFCHGAPSPSNIAFDGRLLDFGASVTLPTWASVSTIFGGTLAGQEIMAMVKILQSMLRQIQHQRPGLKFLQQEITHISQIAMLRYGQRIPYEILRVLGFTAYQATVILKNDDDMLVRLGINRILMHYKFEYFNIGRFDATPEPKKTWLLPDFWSGALDKVAPGLRKRLMAFFFEELAALENKHFVEVQARNARRAATRSMLFRENLRYDIEQTVKKLLQARQLDQTTLDIFIQRYVQANAMPKDAI